MLITAHLLIPPNFDRQKNFSTVGIKIFTITLTTNLPRNEGCGGGFDKRVKCPSTNVLRTMDYTEKYLREAFEIRQTAIYQRSKLFFSMI